jgi:osmotically-inducible protein OsmY
MITTPSKLQRHDSDLERRVRTYLADRFHPSLQRLRVDVQKGTVTLTGQVHSFYEKQVAISACQRVAGVHHLVDAVNVAAPSTLGEVA